jgi:hypothetical protein
MTKSLAAALIAFSAVTANASPAAAACIVIGWTDGRASQPIWECSGSRIPTPPPRRAPHIHRKAVAR